MMTCFLVYLATHFALYVLVLRHLGAFRRELPIFLYHFLPAILVACGAAGAVLIDPSLESGFEAAFVLAAQGIYSLSFLELWALAQGGYSVHILMQMDASRGIETAPADLERFGSGKQHDRLRGLRALGLIRPLRSGYMLTAAGRIVAGFLHAIRRIANVREAGET